MTFSNLPAPVAVPDVTDRAQHAAHKAAGNRWVAYFMRFGHIVRGIIYVVLGVLALRLALGARGEAMTQTGAIETIGQQPFGHTLLVAVAVGLAGYSLWGVIRAVYDPLHKGNSRLGLAKRCGFAASGLAYAGLLVATLGFLVGSRMAESGDWTAKLLAKPFGVWLVGIIGLCWIAVAGIEIVRGWRGRFMRDLDLDRRSAAERRCAVCLGRVGIMTRGIVFSIIGIFLVATAFHENPHQVTGMDGALLGLLRQPFGRALLGVAGLGLMTFGVYSVMCARWMRMRVAEGARNPVKD
jgi:Domain of Unknown Function (DUF1206)